MARKKGKSGLEDLLRFLQKEYLEAMEAEVNVNEQLIRAYKAVAAGGPGSRFYALSRFGLEDEVGDKRKERQAKFMRLFGLELALHPRRGRPRTKQRLYRWKFSLEKQKNRKLTYRQFVRKHWKDFYPELPDWLLISVVKELSPRFMKWEELRRKSPETFQRMEDVAIERLKKGRQREQERTNYPPCPPAIGYLFPATKPKRSKKRK